MKLENILMSKDLLKTYEYDYLKNLKKGLSIAVPLYSFDYYTENYNLKELGCFYRFIFLGKDGFFDEKKTYAEVAKILDIEYTGDKYNRLKIRKTLKKFNVLITFEVDNYDNFKFYVCEPFLSKSYNYKDYELKYQKFIQVPYLLKYINDNNLIVVFMALLSFKNNEGIFPSISSICSRCGTTNRSKIIEILRLGEKLNIWEIEHNKNVRKSNNYKLTRFENNREVFLYIKVLSLIIKEAKDLKQKENIN